MLKQEVTIRNTLSERTILIFILMRKTRGFFAKSSKREKPTQHSLSLLNTLTSLNAA